MTPSADLCPLFFVLQYGDIIKQDDEYYNPTVDQWLPVMEEFIGDRWESGESKPVRRENTARVPVFVVAWETGSVTGTNWFRDVIE